MTSVLRGIFPIHSVNREVHDEDDEYSVDYSFAMEYSGSPVSHEIPRVVPVDVSQIPTASVAARAAMVNNLSLPVAQPILKRSNKKISQGLNSKYFGEIENSKIYLGEMENLPRREGVSGEQSSSSCSTSGFSDGQIDSNPLWGSSDVEDLDDDSKVSLPYVNCSETILENSNTLRPPEITSEISSSEDDEYCASVSSSPSVQGNNKRTPVVTFRGLSPTSDESDGDFPERQAVSDVKKDLCYRCNRKKRFGEKEICIVCGAKYCSKCVIRAMGCMPEGRKCIDCIGFRINESRRGSLGKCSGMLKRLLTRDVMKQIMSSEILCRANQMPPHLVYVNDNPLCSEELFMLQNCTNPPRKLRPGKYWYDKVSGLWGKEGEKPIQIISADLQVGSPIKREASNGDTNVLINNREITKEELWMLKAAGIRCEVTTHFWVQSDGSYQLEGQNHMLGKLWEKKRVKIVCTALSLPLPSDTSVLGDEGVGKEMSKVDKNNLECRTLKKLLLVGCDQSETSTIFKQAKILYKVPFSEDEKQNIKYMIQRNLYSYLAILLEGHERFAEENMIEMRRLADEHAHSENIVEAAEKNIYSFSPRLKAFSTWLLQVMVSNNLEAIFPAATREYSPLVEELWMDKAFQATYKRRNELPLLPRVANFFLDRAVEISRMDYEPSEMDILYAEGFTSSNGVASVEFSFPRSSQDGYMESVDHNDSSTSYQLIRVHATSLGENCKWLEMFEDVNLIIYCVSLTDYDEYHEDINGKRTNKMLIAKKFFETMVCHPALARKHFILVLNKYDLLEEKIERIPLTQCEWFLDFTPAISHHPGNVASNNPPLAQKAFHYVAVKFKRFFCSLTEGRKLFVAPVTGLEGDSVDKALKYGKEVLKWGDENDILNSSMNECSETGEEDTTTG